MNDDSDSTAPQESTSNTGEPTGLVSRRIILGSIGVGLAAGITAYAAATSDLDEDGVSTREELQNGLDPLSASSGSGAMPDELRMAYDLPLDRVYSEQDAAALALADQEYEYYTDRVIEFMHDERLQSDFVDAQLGYWLDVPEAWQQAVITDHSQNWLYANDWNRNGEPHLLPDGTPGPDYDRLEPVNPDHDAFMPGFYNHSGRVHDIVTGEYLGFQPEHGDRVGKQGDSSGEGSIAAYLDGDVSVEDITGRRISVIWFDWMEGPNDYGEEYSLEPSQRVFDVISETLGRAPVENRDGSTGIEFFPILGASLEHKNYGVHGSHERNYEQHVPPSIQGPVNYGVYVYRLEKEGAMGVGIRGDAWHGGLVSFGGRRNPVLQAGVMMHELYGHMIGRMGHAPQSKDTIMAEGSYYNDTPLTFTHGEWAGNAEWVSEEGGILPRMDVVNRGLELDDGNGGFYSLDWPPDPI
jgi:hypothetical protein